MEQKNSLCERPEHRACRLFMCTDRMHRKCFERLVSQLGIHRSQHLMLMSIGRENISSQKELAERMNISTAAVAVTLKKLEAGGYIERVPDEHDSRNNRIFITEEGERVISASRDYISLLDRTMFQGIDGQSLAVFTACLEKMQENLSLFLEDGREEEKQ